MKVRLTTGQVASLMTMTTLPTMTMLLPADMIRASGRDGWLDIVLPLLTAAAIAWGMYRRPHRTIEEEAVQRFGPFVGRLLLLLLAGAVEVYLIVVVAEFAQLAERTYVFGDVPLLVLVSIGVGIAWLETSLGILSLARTAQIALPLLLATVLIVIGAALPFGDLRFALPVGVGHMLSAKAFFVPFVFLAETVFVSTWPLEAPRPWLLPVLTGLSLAAGACALTAWSSVVVLGTDRAMSAIVPVYQVARDVMYAGGFVAHFEVLLIPMLTAGTAIKLGIFSTSVASLLQAAAPRVPSWVFPLVVVLVGAIGALHYFPTTAGVDAALLHVLAPYAMPPLVALPLLIRLWPRRRQREVSRRAP